MGLTKNVDVSEMSEEAMKQAMAALKAKSAPPKGEKGKVEEKGKSG